MGEQIDTKRRTAVAVPVVLATVYARTVMGRQLQGSPMMASMNPSGNPAGGVIDLMKPHGLQEEDNLYKPGGGEQVYP